MTESATKLQQAAVRVRVARRVREHVQRDVDALQDQLEAAQDSLRAARREEQQASSALTSTALDASEDEQQEALWALPEHQPAQQWAVLDGKNRKPGAVPFNQSLIGPVKVSAAENPPRPSVPASTARRPVADRPQA